MDQGEQGRRERGEGSVGAAGEPGNKNKWQSLLCVWACVSVCECWTDSTSLQREFYRTCSRKDTLIGRGLTNGHRAQPEIWKIPQVCVCVSHSLLASRVSHSQSLQQINMFIYSMYISVFTHLYHIMRENYICTWAIINNHKHLIFSWFVQPTT